MTLATHPDHHLWEEKYRPSKLEDVIIPQSLKDGLFKSIQGGAIPSLLLYSPSPGTGKTTTAYAICNELGVKPLFINSSIDNSVDDIRTKVVQYATTSNMFGSSNKVVILDECERLSANAQDSLKGLIEMVSSNCSFILTTNAKARIIEPLASRCDEVDFIYTTADQQVMNLQMSKRVLEILKAEGVAYDMSSVAQVVKRYCPDNRKILKVLQAYALKNNMTIDVGILGKLVDSDALITFMKEKDYEKIKGWCMNNYDRLGDDFYGKMFKTLEGVVVGQSVPQIVLTLNDYQRYHAIVPDRFIHFLSLVTQLMVEVQFKG